MKWINLCSVIWMGGSLMVLACGVRINQQAGTETTARRINVKEYGDTGDVKSADSRFIQTALDSASIGDTVYLPKGTYLVRTIRLVSNVHLVSDGLLKQPDNLSAHFAVEKQHSDAPL